MSIKIGIIGGTGFCDPKLFENVETKEVDTPFGKPSDVLKIGKIKGVDCVLLPRHGQGHSVMPTLVNFRANIHALKAEGCTHILTTTACGSLQEHMKPGDFVVIDQFIDRTTKRIQTFYDGTAAAPSQKICHMPMAEPFCKQTRKVLSDSLRHLGYSFHEAGTMVTIEGPRFSSKAESKLFKSWGADTINMTTIPEVVLAKEAGLCYGAIAIVTDYDCWREDAASVDVQSVYAIFRKTADKACNVIVEAISGIAAEDWTDAIKANQEMLAGSLL